MIIRRGGALSRPTELKNILFYVSVVRSQVEIERNAGNRKGPVTVALFVWQQLKHRGDCGALVRLYSQQPQGSVPQVFNPQDFVTV